MKTFEVHVICLNDFPAFAVIGEESDAQAKMGELREKDYSMNKYSFRSLEEYCHRCHWHIRTVEGIKP